MYFRNKFIPSGKRNIYFLTIIRLKYRSEIATDRSSPGTDLGLFHFFPCFLTQELFQELEDGGMVKNF